MLNWTHPHQSKTGTESILITKYCGMVFLKFVIACKKFLKSFEDFQKLQHINNELFSFVSVTKNLCVS